MARRILTNWDLTGFALIGAMLDPRTSNPAGLGVGDAGRAWFRTDTGRPMIWSGTAAIDILDLGAATGTLTAAKISDFTTAVQAISWGSLANPSAPINAGGQKITNGADGTAGTDFATYGQLLALINNRGFKDPVRAATTANITNLAGGAPNTLDGVTLAANDRILVKDQSTGSLNGIYTVTTLGTGANGTWTRATDFDSTAEAVPGSVLSVQEGTANADKMFMLATNGPITLGTTALVFSAYGASSGEIGVAGNGLTKTGSTYDVGAGNGISVAADSVAVDAAVVVRKVTGTIPTSTGGIFTVSGGTVTINHGLANTCPRVTVRYGSAGAAPGALVEVDDSASDANNVVLVLPGAPSANQYIVMVEG